MEARQKLLESAGGYEQDKFDAWFRGHASYCETLTNGDQLLDARIASKVGFSAAKMQMREIMLTDTVQRLPEVIASLRDELDGCRSELIALEDRQRFTDPLEL
jgi:hypothetical protein